MVIDEFWINFLEWQSIILINLFEQIFEVMWNYEGMVVWWGINVEGCYSFIDDQAVDFVDFVIVN